MSAPYRGRFAPTPSGPLHFGSLVAALGSYLDARAHQGEWHLRIDDLDPPRVQPGAVNAILKCLEQCGLHWDGPVVWQSKRQFAYEHALQQLSRNAHVYACRCTRSQIAEAGLLGVEGYRYPGTCRNLYIADAEHCALRIEVSDHSITFDDLLQGHVEQNLAQATGDFVLRRADGVYAYHLACAVDDAQSQFTHIVRGVDLMDSTPRQIFIQQILQLPTPEYLHLPIAVDHEGNKLSKQTLAAPVDSAHPLSALDAVLGFLNHTPPQHEILEHDVTTLLRWAVAHWQRDALGNIGKQRPAPSFA